MGNTIYLITKKSGDLRLDTRWELKALRATDPVISIEPDPTGDFELVIYDTDAAYEYVEVKGDIARFITESEDDFTRFKSTLTGLDAGLGELGDLSAYTLWTGIQPFRKTEKILSNKNGELKTLALEQPILCLAFADKDRALDILNGFWDQISSQGLVPAWINEKKALYQAAPPIYGYTINHLVKRGDFDRFDSDQLASFYEGFSRAVNWWFSHRTNDQGQCFYAHRHECGWARESIFNAGVPSVTPDLTTYIALATEALSLLADMLGKSDETA